MNEIKSKNIKNMVSELTELKALIQLNKSIKNGHIIRQSMKCDNGSINNWIKPKNKEALDENRYKGLNQDAATQALIAWIKRTYKPTAFLTIQLPDHLKTERQDKAQAHLHHAISCFERQLLGREWYDHQLPFICFMEEGISGCWHFHILFNQGKFRPWHLYLALDNTIRQLGWPSYSIRLDIMNADKKKAIGYCLKEIKVNVHGHFDSHRFILSDELFGFNAPTNIGKE